MTDEETKWRLAKPGEKLKWERSVGALVIEPAIEFVVRTGEIILLAGAFSAAAHLSHNLILRIFSGLMFFALAMHFGMTWSRYVLFPLHGVMVKATWKNSFLISLPAAAAGLLWFVLWQEITKAVALVVPS